VLIVLAVVYSARLFALSINRASPGAFGTPCAEEHALVVERQAGPEVSETRELEERANAYEALYAHWERTQWSSLALDLSVDRTSFAALDPDDQAGMMWIFAHRFHAEFNVARLLAPFLLAAPSYELQLLLATQVADEHRHLQAVLRIYDEVFGVDGGIQAVRALADRHTDPVAEALYARLEHYVGCLSANSDEDEFLAAVTGYHLIAEGVIARTAQNLAGSQFERLDFPGLARGQQLVARDEARHIGIGVTYARRRLDKDPERSRLVIGAVIDDFAELAGRLLATANDGMRSLVAAGYGTDPEGFYTEAMRLLQLRLRSIGFLED
jgi:ribonucleotide reductase beta subunit family protein with ferritin-like domain